MKFTEQRLKGLYLVELEPHIDERGTFARQFCKREFSEHGIDIEICQCNVSKNYKKGTLRGLHFQQQPFPEPKIVCCMQGRIFDVAVDLREGSPTYLDWLAFELDGETGRMLYIPPGFAHGFQVMADNTLVYYMLGNYFNSAYYDGVRWDDPKIGIEWPECANRIINERDRKYELL